MIHMPHPPSQPTNTHPRSSLSNQMDGWISIIGIHLNYPFTLATQPARGWSPARPIPSSDNTLRVAKTGRKESKKARKRLINDQGRMRNVRSKKCKSKPQWQEKGKSERHSPDKKNKNKKTYKKRGEKYK